MKKLLIATKNPGKFFEIKEVLDGLDLELVFLGDLEVEDGDFVEDGETFEENAYKKAAYYSDLLGMPALGEDSGLVVDALPGELGVYTRRWGAGEKASDEEWMEYFMKRMEGESERGAQFVCNACLIGDGGGRRHFEGETRGRLSEAIGGPMMKGIPLSAVFVAEGQEKVYSALSAEEKNQVSHRGKSMMKLRDFLAEQESGA